jgi:hypothetical protein
MVNDAYVDISAAIDNLQEIIERNSDAVLTNKQKRLLADKVGICVTHVTTKLRTQ